MKTDCKWLLSRQAKFSILIITSESCLEENSIAWLRVTKNKKIAWSHSSVVCLWQKLFSQRIIFGLFSFKIFRMADVVSRGFICVLHQSVAEQPRYHVVLLWEKVRIACSFKIAWNRYWPENLEIFPFTDVFLSKYKKFYDHQTADFWWVFGTTPSSRFSNFNVIQLSLFQLFKSGISQHFSIFA